MQAELIRDELLLRAGHPQVLPTLNSIMSELLQVLSDENSSLPQLFDIIRCDQAISSKVISIANSAFYCRRSPVLSLERAILLIGFDEIKNLLTCLIFLTQTLSFGKLSQLDLMRLLEHSLAVAYAAETLSSHLLLGDPEKAFTASIIHDIGKVILLTRADQYQQAIDMAGALNIDISVTEKEIFGIDHQEIGYVMSQKWRFPEQFLDVIRNHHAKPEGKEWLLDVVRIADTFIANPATDLGESSIILQKEKTRMEQKIRKTCTLLGIS